MQSARLQNCAHTLYRVPPAALQTQQHSLASAGSGDTMSRWPYLMLNAAIISVSVFRHLRTVTRRLYGLHAYLPQPTHAECVFLDGPSPQVIAARVADVRAKAATEGRRADGIKLIMGLNVVVGRTAEEARDMVLESVSGR